MKTYCLLIACAAVTLGAVGTAGAKVMNLTRDGQIINSGSTNTTGYHIWVSPSGDAWFVGGTADVSMLQTPPPDSVLSKGKVSKSIARKFYADIKAAEPLSKLPIHHRMKSVSFGTSVFVAYRGQTSPDLSAPADTRGMALSADATTIAAALRLKNQPRRPAVMPIAPAHVGRQ